MEINGLWMYPEFVKAEGMDLGCALMPNLGTKERVIWSSSENLVAFKHRNTTPERTEAVATFFKFLSANRANWAKIGTMPARQSLYKKGGILDMPHVAAVYPEMGDAQILVRDMFVESCNLHFQMELTKVLVAASDPREALRELSSISTRLLQQDPD